MNPYFENGIARQERARTIEEAKYFFNCTCEGWVNWSGAHKGGCHNQSFCQQEKCPVYQAHRARLEYLASGVQNIAIQYTSEKISVKSKTQKLSWKYRAKKSVIHYLDIMAKKAIVINHRKMAVDLENASVQIYVSKDIYKSMQALKEKYPEIYYEAGRRYQKYVPIKEM